MYSRPREGYRALDETGVRRRAIMKRDRRLGGRSGGRRDRRVRGYDAGGRIGEVSGFAVTGFARPRPGIPGIPGCPRGESPESPDVPGTLGDTLALFSSRSSLPSSSSSSGRWTCGPGPPAARTASHAMSPRSTCASAFPARAARRNSRAAASSGSTANVLAAPSRRSMCAALLAALSDPDSANAANVASARHGSGGRRGGFRGGFRARPRRNPARSSASVDPSGSAESSDASFSLTPSPSPTSPKVPSRTSTARSCVSAHPSRSSRNVQNNRAASAQSRDVPAPSRYADASACGARQCPASLATWNSSNARVRFLSAPTPDWCNAPRLNAASGSPAAAPAANASRAAAASRGVPHPL